MGVVHYSLWIRFKDGDSLTLTDVEEFEFGFRYFFVRCFDGWTRSYERGLITSVSRRNSQNSDWVPLLLRKTERSEHEVRRRKDSPHPPRKRRRPRKQTG